MALYERPAINNIVIIVKWAHIFGCILEVTSTTGGFVNNKIQANVEKKTHYR